MIAQALSLRSLQVEVKIGIIALFAAAALFAMPHPAQAAQLTDIQIQAITGLLASFNVDAATISSVDAILHGSASSTPSTVSPSDTGGSGASASTTSSTDMSSSGGPCGSSTQTLSFGDDGPNVENLQNFLTGQGFLGQGNTTGFFGHMTEKALQQWQAQNGIVSSGSPGTTGFGVFGPRSQQFEERDCPDHQGQGDQGQGNGSGQGENHNGNNEGNNNNDNNSGQGESEGSPSATNTPPPATGLPCPPPKPTSACNGTWTVAPGLVPNLGNNCTTGWSCVPPTPTCTLTAATSSVQSGSSVTLTWASTNATYASSPSGTTTPNGSVTVTPTATTIYQKTVFGPGGQASCQATVMVGGSTATSTAQARAQNFDYLTAYSDSFNQNMAAVSVATIGVPFSILIDALGDLFYHAGIY